MSESASVLDGGVLEIPGSTAQGLLSEPLKEWGLVLPGRAVDGQRVLVEGDLDSLVELLERLREEAEGRRKLVRAAGLLGTKPVIRDGLCFLVPAPALVGRLDTDGVHARAVAVREDVPPGL